MHGEMFVKLVQLHARENETCGNGVVMKEREFDFVKDSALWQLVLKRKLLKFMRENVYKEKKSCES